MSDIILLCTKCKNNPNAQVAESLKICIFCRKPDSTRSEYYFVCPTCSQNKNCCEKCGAQLSTAAPGPKGTVVDNEGNVIGHQG